MIILLPCNDHVFPLEMSRSHYVIGYRADHVISDLIGIGHYIPIRDRIYKYMYINSHYFLEDQGFLRHLEFLNPRYALPSRHYITFLPLSSYNKLVCALVWWVSYSRACTTGNQGDAERMWYRQANRQRHFTWQRKEYVKSSGWSGGIKRGLRLTHFSWLYTRVYCHNVASKTNLLTKGRWLANVGIAYAE